MDFLEHTMLAKMTGDAIKSSGSDWYDTNKYSDMYGKDVEDKEAPKSPYAPEKILGSASVKLQHDPALRIRKDADKSSEVIGWINNGQKFDYTGELHGWLHIKTADQKTGWISKQYTSLYGDGQAPKASAKDETPLSSAAADKAIAWFNSENFSPDYIKEIQALVGAPADGVINLETVQAVPKWQKDNGLSIVDGMFGNGSAKKAGLTPKRKDNVVKPAAEPVDQSGGGAFFTLEQMTYSNTAKARKLDNSIPNMEIKNNLLSLITNALDPIRQAFGAPININSGYRGVALNKAVGGAASSQHCKGQAADLGAGSREANKRLYKVVKELGVYDQLINEYDYKWVHVSYKDGGNRKMELKIG